ncbi:unnamed protein product [Enterobius vermicularis]|uniref:Uncharacterized protein n=1 Tax=Enterobius vermicularis TaxID=51028 RepID=A0A0N4VNL5_ENTVE|nr:unnamed protein product [Enterobius vermicularis]
MEKKEKLRQADEKTRRTRWIADDQSSATVILLLVQSSPSPSPILLLPFAEVMLPQEIKLATGHNKWKAMRMEERRGCEEQGQNAEFGDRM